MKKQLKIIILIVMCLAVVGIYFGKNVYFKKESSKEQAKTENQSSINNAGVPVLLEFSTQT